MEINNDTLAFLVNSEAVRVSQTLAGDDPFRNVYLSMIQSTRPDFVEDFLKSRDDVGAVQNAVARAFRKNPRMAEMPEPEALVKSGEAPAEIMKANLDVGTLTNFAQITGGQTLGYVSLDTQIARGTVRPGSFTMYQCLAKSRAFQVVDYWSAATDTGGPPPGAAFASYSSQTNGNLATSAGLYNLNNITLKLLQNGRSITTALAAQNSFVDVTAQENINAALTVLESINWACYWGDPSLFANQFQGIYSQIQIGTTSGMVAGASGNIVDYQQWYNAYGVSAGWSAPQTLFNLIYAWAAQITSYNRFGRITHAFMSPTCAASLQGLVTTLLNNVVTEITSHMGGNTPIVVNGDLQGMRTRFGEIQFPIDLYITARDIPVAGVYNSNGTSMATTSAPTPPTAAAATVSGASVSGSAWTAAYTTASGWYTYAVAACDASMNESTLTYVPSISGVAVNSAYSIQITGAATTDFVAFRIFRSGLGERQSIFYPSSGLTPLNPGSYRHIGTVLASGSSVVANFVDLNTKIPGAETVFLLDMDERDNAVDYRYLLPLTKIELFAQNLFMPWAVAAIGGVRVRIPKFHGIIKNYVGDNPAFNPLSTNSYTP
jgi:hypothetical protein